MSVGSIGNQTAATIRSNGATGADTRRAEESAPPALAATPDGDTVEISAEARALAENPPVQEEYKPYSAIKYETPLVPGSEEEKKFRNLLKSVTERKSDIMSRINDIFERNGISRQDFANMKIEVDRSGKIMVGGIEDENIAKAVEEALNADSSLGRKILDFQHEEGELSGLLKKYTGASLFELTMTQRGDINPRIRNEVEENGGAPQDSYYTGLYFLGGNLNNVVDANDIAQLGFAGGIDFSGEVKTMAQPEREIKEEMTSLYAAVLEEFDKHNAEVAKRLEDAGIEVTDDSKKSHFLDASAVGITVSNLGEVLFDGVFSTNEANNEKAEGIVRKLVMEMLNKTEDNSYHVNVFRAASETLLANTAGVDNRSWNAKVAARIMGGSVEILPVA